MQTTYSEKLRHPKWQAKRLEILNRDSFTCQLCGDTETELHVHHKYYLPDYEPHEYESEVYQTLCKHCHKIVEAYKGYNQEFLVLNRGEDDDDGSRFVNGVSWDYAKNLYFRIIKISSVGEITTKVVLSMDNVSGINKLFEHAKKLIPAHAKQDFERLD